MADQTPNADLPVMPENSFQVWVPFNLAMQIIDAFLPLAVQDKDLAAPPTTGAGDVGKRWIVAASPTGAWAGQAGKVALCSAAGLWVFLDPPPYIRAYVIDEDKEYRNMSGTWTLIP